MHGYMKDQSEIELGKSYLVGGVGTTPSVFYRVADAGVFDRDGLVQRRYSFARVSPESIAVTGIHGSDLCLRGDRVLDNSNGYATSFARSEGKWAIEYARIIEEIMAAEANPRKVEIVRRELTKLADLSELELLLPDRDVLRFSWDNNGSFRNSLALYRGKVENSLSLVWRTPNGTISQAEFDLLKLQSLTYSAGLDLRGAEVRNSRETYADNIRTTLKDFEKMDELLKSRGIVR